MGKSISIHRPSEIIGEIVDTASRFGDFAVEAGAEKERGRMMMESFRLFRG